MAFASAVLMFAGSPQTFLGAASAQNSLFLTVDIVSVYGRQFSNELGRTLARLSSRLTSPSNKPRKSDGILPFLAAPSDARPSFNDTLGARVVGKG
jgi:hypothetical protein